MFGVAHSSQTRLPFLPAVSLLVFDFHFHPDITLSATPCRPAGVLAAIASHDMLLLPPGTWNRYLLRALTLHLPALQKPPRWISRVEESE